VAKSKANSGSAAVLDEGADEFLRSPADQEFDERASRSSRATASRDEGDGEPFLRSRRRVPVRRGMLPGWARSRWGKVAFAASTAAALGVTVAAILETRSFLEHDRRFRIESAASIQTLGNSQLSRADLLSVFGADIGRNLFLVSAESRRTALEQIPWVERATVMRLMPNQLRVAITERTPIAFVQVHGRIELADVNGVILTMSPEQMAARHYSFVVVTGISPADPLSLRAARMHLYQTFISNLDATGEHVSSQLSEVDLSDPDDVRATAPANGTDLMLHFGDENFLPRWHNYQAHIAQWRQQYPHLASIDLRYDREVVLKMAGDPEAPSQSTAAAAKPADPAPMAAAPPKAAARATTDVRPGAKNTEPAGKEPSLAKAAGRAPVRHGTATVKGGRKPTAMKHKPTARGHEAQTKPHGRRTE
jgi:cell division protein FtsQ